MSLSEIMGQLQSHDTLFMEGFIGGKEDEDEMKMNMR